MLSRIANNLYWAGRYLERMEHVARAVPVIYFSALDGPEEVDLVYSLKGIEGLTGSPLRNEPLKENEVLFRVAFDKSNPSSLLSCARSARENCRGSRDILSTELWESINTLFHYISSYDQNVFLTTGMQQLTLSVLSKIALCKARIETTLLRNEAWAVLSLGLLIERSYQIINISSVKLLLIKTLNTKAHLTVETYEMTNLLKSLESYDMNRKFYRKLVDRKNTLEFLLLNSKFPRSILFCIERISEQLDLLAIEGKEETPFVKHEVERLRDELTTVPIGDILINPLKYLSMLEAKIARMNTSLTSYYFIK